MCGRGVPGQDGPEVGREVRVIGLAEGRERNIRSGITRGFAYKKSKLQVGGARRER